MERDIVFVQILNRDPSDATAIVYSNDDLNMILIMSLSYYADHLLVVKRNNSRWRTTSLIAVVYHHKGGDQPVELLL